MLLTTAFPQSQREIRYCALAQTYNPGRIRVNNGKEVCRGAMIKMLKDQATGIIETILVKDGSDTIHLKDVLLCQYPNLH